MQKLLLHSDQDAVVNSKGYLDMRGEQGNKMKNKAEGYQAEDPILPLGSTECAIHFRPHNDWHGEYGFDWFRIKDTGMEGDSDFRETVGYYYKDKEMEKKYEGVELPNPKYFEKDEKLLKNLKKIFKKFKVNTSIDKEGIYFVPKITLLKGEKAVLKLIVKKLDTIKEDDLLSFEFKENEKYKKCFKLSYKEITIGELIKNQRIFEIECTEEFASEAPIFLEIKIKDKRCGVLQIYPNNKENIKRISIILIKIGEGNIKNKKREGIYKEYFKASLCYS